MDWQGFNRHLLGKHSGRPQELMALTQATRDAESALATLAKLGHLFHLVSGVGEAWPVWPRTLYNLHVAPNGRGFTSEDELRSAGPGWYDTLEDAQHQNGHETIMRSRGNVPRSATVPMVVERQPNDHERIELRLAQHDEAKERALRENENSSAT